MDETGVTMISKTCRKPVCLSSSPSSPIEDWYLFGKDLCMIKNGQGSTDRSSRSCLERDR